MRRGACARRSTAPGRVVSERASQYPDGLAADPAPVETTLLPRPCPLDDTPEVAYDLQHPCPDRAYLELLGRAAYTWSYTEWTMLYTIVGLTGEGLDHHVRDTGGAIVGTLASTLVTADKPPFVTAAMWVQARDVAKELEETNGRRNDIFHARPATNDEDVQRLYRWDPTRDKATPGFIDSEDLVDFIRRVEESRSTLTSLLEQLRRQRD